MNLPIDSFVYIFAIASFGLLILPTLLRANQQDRATGTLTIYLALGLIWSIGSVARVMELKGSASMDFGIARLTETARVLMPLVFAVLTMVFLKRTQRLMWLVGVGLVALAAWLVFRLESLNVATPLSVYINAYTLPDMVAYSLEVLLWAIPTFMAAWHLYQSIKAHYQSELLNRLQYWFISLSFLLIANIAFLFPYDLPYIAQIGPAINIVGVVLTSYIVLLYHPPDLRILFSRLTESIVTTLAFSLFVFGALAGAYYFFMGPVDVLTVSTIAGISVALAFVMPYIHRQLRYLLHKMIFGLPTDTEGVLDTYSRNLGGELSIERLCERVLELVLQETGAQRGAIFLDNGEGSGNVTLLETATVGVDVNEVGYFSADDPWVTYLRQEQRPITQYNIDVLPQYREMTPESKDWLANLHMEIFIPITLRQRDLLGVLALGPKPNQTPYLGQDLARLVLLTSQTALDIDKVKIFNQLGRVNQKLEELSSQMENTDQGKTDFLSIASHELRTPLTQIHGYAAMLVEATEEDLKSPAYMQQIFKGIAKGSTRLKDVVDLIFEVSKSEVGELELSIRTLNVGDIISEALESQAQAIEQRGHQLQIDALNHLPDIEADRARMAQALAQLINNAIKYTPDGGTIHISGKTHPDEGEATHVQLIISDTGIGIDNEDHDRIFEKFYRVGNVNHHSTSNVKFKGAGPGLGLALVRGIVRAHSGRVWVKSIGYDENNYPGSQFYVTLPLKQPENPPEPGDSTMLDTQPWSSENQQKLREQTASEEA